MAGISRLVPSWDVDAHRVNHGQYCRSCSILRPRWPQHKACGQHSTVVWDLDGHKVNHGQLSTSYSIGDLDGYRSKTWPAFHMSSIFKPNYQLCQSMASIPRPFIWGPGLQWSKWMTSIPHFVCFGDMNFQLRRAWPYIPRHVIWGSGLQIE